MTFTAPQLYAAVALALFVGTALGIFILSMLTMSSRADRDEAGVQASQIDREDELLSIAKRTVELLENVSVETGACCCGDSMKNHANPMDCGHTPLDSGADYGYELLRDARKVVALHSTNG